jgi:hypothetical protein
MLVIFSNLMALTLRPLRMDSAVRMSQPPIFPPAEELDFSNQRQILLGHSLVIDPELGHNFLGNISGDDLAEKRTLYKHPEA